MARRLHRASGVLELATTPQSRRWLRTTPAARSRLTARQSPPSPADRKNLRSRIMKKTGMFLACVLIAACGGSKKGAQEPVASARTAEPEPATDTSTQEPTTPETPTAATEEPAEATPP